LPADTVVDAALVAHVLDVPEAEAARLLDDLERQDASPVPQGPSSSTARVEDAWEVPRRAARSCQISFVGVGFSASFRGLRAR
jgi:hypothetical protein